MDNSKCAERKKLLYGIIYKSGVVYVADLPDDPCKRCGWFFLSSDWIYRLLGTDDPFQRACAFHDDLYDKELRGDITRKEADDLFLEAMKAILREGRGNKWIAYTYYGVARSVGWLYW